MITVLGGSGFIGSHLLKRLGELKVECLAPRRGEELSGRNLGDVVYCIGLTSDFRSRPFDAVDAHVCQLLKFLRDCEFDSLLYLSSSRLYEADLAVVSEEDPSRFNSLNPSHLYNLSKAMGESLAFASSKKTRVVRISNVYGDDFESNNFLSSIVSDAVSKGSVMVQTAADSEKDYISIDDVVDGLIKVATGGRERLYNLASGINVAHGQLTKKLSEHTGCAIEFAPDAPTTRFPVINIDRMRTEFGFEPASVLDDLPGLVNSYRRRFGGLD